MPSSVGGGSPDRITYQGDPIAGPSNPEAPSGQQGGPAPERGPPPATSPQDHHQGTCAYPAEIRLPCRKQLPCRDFDTLPELAYPAGACLPCRDPTTLPSLVTLPGDCNRKDCTRHLSRRRIPYPVKTQGLQKINPPQRQNRTQLPCRRFCTTSRHPPALNQGLLQPLALHLTVRIYHLRPGLRCRPEAWPGGDQAYTQPIPTQTSS